MIRHILVVVALVVSSVALVHGCPSRSSGTLVEVPLENRILMADAQSMRDTVEQPILTVQSGMTFGIQVPQNSGSTGYIWEKADNFLSGSG